MFNYLKINGNGKTVNYWTLGTGIGREDAIGLGDCCFTTLCFQELQIFILPLSSDWSLSQWHWGNFDWFYEE